ncbi:hypothetical protein CFR78_06585 [Komagataeibacter rhaeticus]|uniref:Uncharacterized protein n=1 Tax=Komagataeibacter rhaeticus TaxID=215221 RepID=A0A181C838_9PROT|nr:hypothetical protein [Komagataeibacter rhaeticus]ATU74429.1 hypothetical protein CT154_12460 [Komagataeibacter xylinus]EGG75888.1 hypothetical protein SXCC_03246 [Gluconacetobacter sp. SXCC-1]KDU95381.1 hypothetical protein GLUCORHAEAF1_09160 [Komagataeibacter rhaeticus AF1]MBL7239945.1 hypothetical protein [Komagataeibacter rhaeticus]PYD54159.1 hypothetical protein CFR78_06585 [Komagataeibacter rhaeticus]
MLRIVIALVGVLALCAVGGFFSLGAFPPAPVQQAIHKDIPFAPPAPPAAAALPALPGAPAPLPVTPLAPLH